MEDRVRDRDEALLQLNAVFQLSRDIRYVAILDGPSLQMEQRPGLANASASESDYFEEQLVNPTLMTLARRRGEIDCGGLEYLVVRYGNFSQLVMPLPDGDGHISIGFEPWANPMDHAPEVAGLLRSDAAVPSAKGVV